MRQALLDPNWGRIPEFSVTFTAPGCPEGTPEDPNEAPGGVSGYGNDGNDVISAIFDGVVMYRMVVLDMMMEIPYQLVVMLKET